MADPRVVFWEKIAPIRQAAAEAVAGFLPEGPRPVAKEPSLGARLIDLGPFSWENYIYPHANWRPEHLWVHLWSDELDTVELEHGAVHPWVLLSELERLTEDPLSPEEIRAQRRRVARKWLLDDDLIASLLQRLDPPAREALLTYLSSRFSEPFDAEKCARQYLQTLDLFPPSAHVYAERAFVRNFHFLSDFPESGFDSEALGALEEALDIEDCPPWLLAQAVLPLGSEHAGRLIPGKSERLIQAVNRVCSPEIAVEWLVTLAPSVDEWGIAGEEESDAWQSTARRAEYRGGRAAVGVSIPDGDVDEVAESLSTITRRASDLWPRELRQEITQTLAPAFASACTAASARFVYACGDPNAPPAALWHYAFALALGLSSAKAIGNLRIVSRLAEALAEVLKPIEAFERYYGLLYMRRDPIEEWLAVAIYEPISGAGFDLRQLGDDEYAALALSVTERDLGSERLRILAAVTGALAVPRSKLRESRDLPPFVRELLADLPGDALLGDEDGWKDDLAAQLEAMRAELSDQVSAISPQIAALRREPPMDRGRRLFARHLPDFGNQQWLAEQAVLLSDFGRFDPTLRQIVDIATKPGKAEWDAGLAAACRDRAASVENALRALFGSDGLRLPDRSWKIHVDLAELAEWLKAPNWSANLNKHDHEIVMRGWPADEQRTRLGNLIRLLAQARKVPVHRPQDIGDLERSFFLPELVESPPRPDDGRRYDVFALVQLLAEGAERLKL